MTKAICPLCLKKLDETNSDDPSIFVVSGQVHQSCYINKYPFKGSVDLKSAIADKDNSILIMELANNMIPDHVKDKILKHYNNILRARHFSGLDAKEDPNKAGKNKEPVKTATLNERQGNTVIKLPNLNPKQKFAEKRVLNKGAEENSSASKIKVLFSKKDVREFLEQRKGIELAIHAKSLVSALIKADTIISFPRLERLLRHHIEALRLEGVPICSNSSHGYYMASSEDDINATCNLLYSRAMKSMEQIAKMKGSDLPDFKAHLNI